MEKPLDSSFVLFQYRLSLKYNQESTVSTESTIQIPVRNKPPLRYNGPPVRTVPTLTLPNHLVGTTPFRRSRTKTNRRTHRHLRHWECPATPRRGPAVGLAWHRPRWPRDEGGSPPRRGARTRRPEMGHGHPVAHPTSTGPPIAAGRIKTSRRANMVLLKAWQDSRIFYRCVLR